MSHIKHDMMWFFHVDWHDAMEHDVMQNNELDGSDLKENVLSPEEDT